MTGMTAQTEVIADVAEVVATKGPDPVMLALICMMLLMFLGLLVWLMKRSDARQDDVMEDYQDRMTRQENSFKADLKEQREVHERSLERLSSSFERALNRVVESNEANLNKITERMDALHDQVQILEHTVHATRKQPPPRRKRERLKINPVEIEPIDVEKILKDGSTKEKEEEKEDEDEEVDSSGSSEPDITVTASGETEEKPPKRTRARRVLKKVKPLRRTTKLVRSKARKKKKEEDADGI